MRVNPQLHLHLHVQSERKGLVKSGEFGTCGEALEFTIDTQSLLFPEDKLQDYE